jgi:hypothetical protein
MGISKQKVKKSHSQKNLCGINNLPIQPIAKIIVTDRVSLRSCLVFRNKTASERVFTTYDYHLFQ